jgi:hypothetical protein
VGAPLPLSPNIYKLIQVKLQIQIDQPKLTVTRDFHGLLLNFSKVLDFLNITIIITIFGITFMTFTGNS